MIVAQSHFVITGRYHGLIIAKALGIPYEAPIFNFKRLAEAESGFDITHAGDPINYLRHYIENNGEGLDAPDTWIDDNNAPENPDLYTKRNDVIILANAKFPQYPISFLQAMNNMTLYRLMTFGYIF